MTESGTPRPGPEHRRLEAFVGRWETRGEVLAGPHGPAVPIAGVDSYEWLPGGFFLLHRVDVRMGGEPVEALEVIGHDADAGGYFMHSYDSQGSAGTMRASEQDGVWTFQGEAERFTGGFGDGGRVLSGRWERREGPEWIPWMDVTLTRAG
ncbi:MAG: DUF1579 family protein [Longimicrobiaceae bacterium]